MDEPTAAKIECEAPILDIEDVDQQSIPIPDKGHGSGILSGMADPFEVRMRFTSQLQHLNASVTSAQKAAQYAIKYKDMDEDLHSCILEQLEKVRFYGFILALLLIGYRTP
jgi:hypothetical protein